MKTTFLRPLLLVGILSLLTACAGPSLATRIDQGMVAYDSWPEETQAMVSKGEIDIGFTREQVRMAWGEPSYATNDRVDGGDGERWVWEKKTPRIGIGIGVGSWGRHSSVSTSVGTTVGGEERIVRTVWFKDDAVYSYSE